MSYHLYGAVLTSEGVASNNRGESAGNVSTIQKIVRGDDVHTTVSAEAIRYAMREYWTRLEKPVNRQVSPDGSTWNDTDFDGSESDYLDDDLFGYMDPSEDTNKRRGRFEISRAVSTQPWSGDVVFNVASEGAHPTRDNPAPYTTEIHNTRYQYLFSLTPSQLHEESRLQAALNAVRDLSGVAGNHSRYLYDFAPEAVVLRWTHDPAPRMMYCFDEAEDGSVDLQKIVAGLESGDLDGDEMAVGGLPVSGLADRLETHGVSVYDGIKKAFAEIQNQAFEDLGVEEGT